MYNMNIKRMVWVDWMKVIGMYFIVVGHFFPAGYSLIYTFSVPLFFLISGFLFKNENQTKVFWKKIALNYIIPLFIIRTIMYFWERYIYYDSSQFISIIQYWLFMLKGYQNCNGACWFIYSLILLKIIFQFLPNKNTYILLLGGIITLIAYYLNINNIHKGNAILNITVAYQPFAIGVLLKRYKNQLDQYQPSIAIIISMFLYSLLTILFCAKINGHVWVYDNGYGKSILLYLIGSFNGAIGVYALSKLFNHYAQTFIQTLSMGNIITLGFHQVFVNIIRMSLPPLPYFSYILALAIMILFYPLILLCKNWFPILLGVYHNTSK